MLAKQLFWRHIIDQITKLFLSITGLLSYFVAIMRPVRPSCFSCQGNTQASLIHSKKRTTCCNTVANRTEQLLTVVNNSVHHCYTPDSRSTYCFILLTTVNIVGSKTLFNPVIQQAQSFWAVSSRECVSTELRCVLQCCSMLTCSASAFCNARMCVLFFHRRTAR